MSESTDSPKNVYDTPEDPVSERREAMLRGLGSWNLEGAVPSEFGLTVMRKYVAGDTDIDGAIQLLKERYPAKGAAHE